MTEQSQLTGGTETAGERQPQTPDPEAAVPAAPDGTSLAEPDGTPPAASQTTAPRDRRVLRAVARWTAAVVVFAVVGAGTAYGISRVERTDVPGLATASDGRWDYPELTRPPLPAGRPGPFAEENKAGAHYADLRALLLPAPPGATEDKTLRGTGGWLPTSAFLAEFEEARSRTEIGGKLNDAGLRHIAARGWTTPDGTRTRVYLLQFNTAELVVGQVFAGFVSSSSPVHQLRGAAASVFDDDFPVEAGLDEVERTSYTEIQPYGAEQVRQAYVSAGDVLAVVIQSRKGGAAAVPFQQTVVLQSQLLT
ncbi:hypothetical protein [Streptomyces sp. NPDC049915]|uniref:hypothetical protein n=1 Tax=Streptomyces sp. NPDC049915 TaxID=3155510 RepID=UPI0034424A79